MEKFINRIFGLFFVTIVGLTPLYGVKSKVKKVTTPAERIIKEISLLNQIMDQARLLVNTEDLKVLLQAKIQLINLMNSKELDVKIKDLIKDDIEIITRTTEIKQKVVQEAYDRLVIIAKQIEAQENIIVAMKEGAELVKNAPEDEKQNAIQKAQEKIEEAEAEQGMLSRLYTGAKRIITAPVNYIFGQESSKAKTAFYAAVGAAILSAGVYALSSSEEIPQKLEKSDLLLEKDKNKGKETLTLSIEPLSFEQSIEEKRKQLEAVINYSTVERFTNDLHTKRWLGEIKENWLTNEEKQELEDVTKKVALFRSQMEGLKQYGITENEIQDAFNVQIKALQIAEREKEARIMTDVAEMQRKYLKSAEPEDRELLYSYEDNIRDKNSIPWEKIYESRNKIRQEERIEKDFELMLLAKIQRKYLNKFLNERDESTRGQLYNLASHMFDSLSPKEINTLRKRVEEEVEKGIDSGNNIIQNMSDEESEKEFKKFTQKFAPPLNIRETIAEHKSVKFGFLEGKDENSNVFAKGDNYSRLFNAERIRNCIESNNFTTLAVAKKWIYKVNGQWRVYAEYIPSKKAKFTLDEIKELAEFAEQTGFMDWSNIMKDRSGQIVYLVQPNVVEDKRNKKITIIDTEDKSFEITGYRDSSFSCYNCKLQYVYNLYAYFHTEMDDAAKRWIQKRINYLKNHTEGTVRIEPLPQSGQFDDPNFDFEKIKKELEEDTNLIDYF